MKFTINLLGHDGTSATQVANERQLATSLRALADNPAAIESGDTWQITRTE